ncbi:hypothetical protein P22_1314 [Propionispora sp. 2/2-37]|uniref:radical SAM protein n=1 Tax=Propionispora sp. 2/2-37 TaxID=1677858 RepID=UPI0006BB61E6|nr:radical SAM protein [Propionispora sp. 2/2-37]CUH95244.1 hypothetical protein P22_1314 [Propionispora sp. 2/2-37]
MTLWKLSAGTASVIGIKRIKSAALPRTAYIMLGETCRNHCSFCSQAAGSQGKRDFLSRISWHECSAREAVPPLAQAYAEGGIKRICLQVVDGENTRETTLEALKQLQAGGIGAICVSRNLQTAGQVHELLASGAEKICIAMDAAAPDIYRRVKVDSWESKWKLLMECARLFPGRISTHLIIGLGETEEQAVEFIADCTQRGITVGLFAFTPLAGTPLAAAQPPAIGQYRRVQIAHFLLRKGYEREVIRCAGGRIVDIAVPGICSLLLDGSAFETTGCPDCNRPYYNERPGGTMYNYPRPLTAAETEQAIGESGLGGEQRGLAYY